MRIIILKIKIHSVSNPRLYILSFSNNNIETDTKFKRQSYEIYDMWQFQNLFQFTFRFNKMLLF